MKKDILSRDDLHLIVSEFYVDLLKDPHLSNFFEDFRDEKKLHTHLDVLVDFWDNILFYSGSYSKNAIQPHIKIHSENRITGRDFESWLQLFQKAVDDHFEGQNADTIKSRALSIATVMRIKLNVV